MQAQTYLGDILDNLIRLPDPQIQDVPAPLVMAACTALANNVPRGKNTMTNSLTVQSHLIACKCKMQTYTETADTHTHTHTRACNTRVHTYTKRLE